MTQQALIAFFEQAAQKDKALLDKLKLEKSFNVDNKSWQFTLPKLHSFLQDQDEAFSYIDYEKFRQILFSSPVNQSIKLYGAEINISDNQNKVDRSLYALVWK